jgi:hypothetical protein
MVLPKSSAHPDGIDMLDEGLATWTREADGLGLAMKPFMPVSSCMSAKKVTTIAAEARQPATRHAPIAATTSTP